jgi:8-oxo-dGTP diphosphatase
MRQTETAFMNLIKKGFDIMNNVRIVVTFLHYKSGYHSVCFFFHAHSVLGDLLSNEPEKQSSHWIHLDGIENNHQVPAYHRDFLQKMLNDNEYLNAQVEWIGQDETLKWTIVDSRQRAIK